MDPILALIADLYAQVRALQQENAALREHGATDAPEGGASK